jgi:hypothetical protein
LLLLSGYAFAGDTSDSSTTQAQHQQMKDCMQQQKAQNSSASKEDMHKACKHQLKMSKASSVPNQTTPTTTGAPAPQSGSETNPPTSEPK